MERLTKKVENDYTYENKYNQAYHKLGRIEDLEEELGCPLDVVFKAQKQNKIYYQFFNELQEWNNIKIDIRKMVVRFAWQPHLNKYASEVPLSEYGKTWWLRKDKSE